MKQLFYNIADGIVHQIRREKQATISEVIALFSEANLDGTDAESPFRYFSLFLPHLRTLVQEKRSQNCLRFGAGGPSLCLYQLLSQNIIVFPSLTIAALAKKILANRFAHPINVHYRDLYNSPSYSRILIGSRL